MAGRLRFLGVQRVGQAATEERRKKHGDDQAQNREFRKFKFHDPLFRNVLSNLTTSPIFFFFSVCDSPTKALVTQVSRCRPRIWSCTLETARLTALSWVRMS